MTGATRATAIWHRLDGEGTDRCRLAEVEGGWLLVGHARWVDAGVPHALDYAVRAAPDWSSLGADVTGLSGGVEVALRIEKLDGGWVLNGATRVSGDCVDIDLGFTPATNLLPIRRLVLPEGVEVQTSAAWLDLTGRSLRLSRLDQTYRRRDAGRVDYASPAHDFRATLSVAPCGFVTDYPGLWAGSVDVGDG